MKRILALAAALCLTLCLAVTAFAEGVDFTVKLPEDYVQQSETQYISTDNYIGDNQYTVVVDLLQMPRTDSVRDPYSEEGMKQIARALADETFEGMTFYEMDGDPELQPVGNGEYQSVLLQYNCLQGNRLVKLADYRMYSDDTVYIVRCTGDIVRVMVAAGGAIPYDTITFADGIEVPAPEPEPTPEPTPEPEEAAPADDGPTAGEVAREVGSGLGNGLARLLVAFVIGGAITGLVSLSAMKKHKKALGQCETFAQDRDAFLHEGRYYNRSKYIELRAQQFDSLTRSQISTQIKKLSGRVKTPLDEADLIALRMAYERK